MKEILAACVLYKLPRIQKRPELPSPDYVSQVIAICLSTFATMTPREWKLI